jgi:hypothetical protein
MIAAEIEAEWAIADVTYGRATACKGETVPQAVCTLALIVLKSITRCAVNLQAKITRRKVFYSCIAHAH